MPIDWWTLALQTVNVLILVWLLARFFCRPVAAMIVAKRQEQASKLLADAVAARQEAPMPAPTRISARATSGKSATS